MSVEKNSSGEFNKVAMQQAVTQLVENYKKGDNAKELIQKYTAHLFSQLENKDVQQELLDTIKSEVISLGIIVKELEYANYKPDKLLEKIVIERIQSAVRKFIRGRIHSEAINALINEHRKNDPSAASLLNELDLSIQHKFDELFNEFDTKFREHNIDITQLLSESLTPYVEVESTPEASPQPTEVQPQVETKQPPKPIEEYHPVELEGIHNKKASKIVQKVADSIVPQDVEDEYYNAIIEEATGNLKALQAELVGYINLNKDKAATRRLQLLKEHFDIFTKSIDRAEKEALKEFTGISQIKIKIAIEYTYKVLRKSLEQVYHGVAIEIIKQSGIELLPPPVVTAEVKSPKVKAEKNQEAPDFVAQTKTKANELATPIIEKSKSQKRPEVLENSIRESTFRVESMEDFLREHPNSKKRSEISQKIETEKALQKILQRELSNQLMPQGKPEEEVSVDNAREYYRNYDIEGNTTPHHSEQLEQRTAKLGRMIKRFNMEESPEELAVTPTDLLSNEEKNYATALAKKHIHDDLYVQDPIIIRQEIRDARTSINNLGNELMSIPNTEKSAHKNKQFEIAKRVALVKELESLLENFPENTIPATELPPLDVRMPQAVPSTPPTREDAYQYYQAYDPDGHRALQPGEQAYSAPQKIEPIPAAPTPASGPPSGPDPMPAPVEAPPAIEVVLPENRRREAIERTTRYAEFVFNQSLQNQDPTIIQTELNTIRTKLADFKNILETAPVEDTSKYRTLLFKKFAEENLLNKLNELIPTWELRVNEPNIDADVTAWKNTLLPTWQRLVSDPDALRNAISNTLNSIEHPDDSYSAEDHKTEIESLTREYLLADNTPEANWTLLSNQINDYRNHIQLKLLSEAKLKAIPELLIQLTQPTAAEISTAKENDKRDTDIKAEFESAISKPGPNGIKFDIGSIAHRCSPPTRDLETDANSIRAWHPTDRTDEFVEKITRLRVSYIEAEVYQDRINRRKRLLDTFARDLKLTPNVTPEQIKDLLTQPELYKNFIDKEKIPKRKDNKEEEKKAIQTKLDNEFNIEKLTINADFAARANLDPNATKELFKGFHQEIITSLYDTTVTPPRYSQELLDGEQDAHISNQLENMATKCVDYHTADRYGPAFKDRLEKFRSMNPEELKKLRDKHEKGVTIPPNETLESLAKEHTGLESFQGYRITEFRQAFGEVKSRMETLKTESDNLYKGMLDALNDPANFAEHNRLKELWKTSFAEYSQNKKAHDAMKSKAEYITFDRHLTAPEDGTLPETLIKDFQSIEKEWKGHHSKLDKILKDGATLDSPAIIWETLGGPPDGSKLTDKSSLNDDHLKYMILRRYTIDWILHNQQELQNKMPMFINTDYFKEENLIELYKETFLKPSDAPKIADYLPDHVNDGVRDKLLDARDKVEDEKYKKLTETREHLLKTIETSSSPYKEYLTKQFELLEARYNLIQDYLRHRNMNDPHVALGEAYMVDQQGDRRRYDKGNKSRYINSAAVSRPISVTEKELFADILPSYEATANFLVMYHDRLNDLTSKKSKGDPKKLDVLMQSDVFRTLAQLPSLLLNNPADKTVWLKSKDIQGLTEKIDVFMSYQPSKPFGMTDVDQFMRYSVDQAEHSEHSFRYNYIDAFENQENRRKILKDPKHLNDINHFELLFRAGLVKAKKVTIERILPSKIRSLGARLFPRVFSRKNQSNRYGYGRDHREAA